MTTQLHDLGKPQRYYRDKYLRNLPTEFCSGCGNGTILNCFARAVDALIERKELRHRDLLCVSGIGCASWIPSPHFRADTMHTTHGRSIVFATGAKVMNPKLRVAIITGDGDAAAIGGNHLIHAARRNLPMMVVVVNNFNYGMTGGQSAPTTPLHVQTTTYPSHPEAPFDLCRLALGAGASYVARWTTFYVDDIIGSMQEALLHPGFAFIEVFSQCPTYTARFFAEYQATLSAEDRAKFQRAPGAWMLKALKGNKIGEAYGHPKYELLLKDKPVELGVLHREQRPTLIEALQSLWTTPKGDE